MIVQQRSESSPTIAGNTLSFATLGASGALQRKVAEQSATLRATGALSPVPLTEPLRQILGSAFAAAGGGLADTELKPPNREWQPFPCSIGTWDGGEVVFINLPADVVSDSRNVPSLFQLQRALRGRTVRFVSHELNGRDPEWGVMGNVFQDWSEYERPQKIDARFVPPAVLEALSKNPSQLAYHLVLERRPASTASNPAPASQPSAPPQLRTLKIFLASSKELRDDRDEFDRYCREQNDDLRHRGYYLQIVRWENFLDAMSDTGLQSEYNKKVETCDVFVSLFFTKTGSFTKQEFDIAYRTFESTKKRPRIYTYFKDGEVRLSTLPKDDLRSLWAFQDSLATDYKHYPTLYEGIEGLKRHFRDQLDDLLVLFKD
jgi:hypothetical protein